MGTGTTRRSTRDVLTGQSIRTVSAPRRGVAQLKLDCPPPCSWDAAHASAFIEQIAAFGDDPEVCAIVLHGRRLFNDVLAAKTAPDDSRSAVYAAVASSTKPIVAALSGPVTGSGLELALACGARVALPNVTISNLARSEGHLPAAETLIRLARLVEVERAADLAVFNAVWDSKAAVEQGLIDLVAARDLLQVAEKLAAGCKEERRVALTAEPEVVAAKIYGLRAKVRREAPQQTAPMMLLRAMELAWQTPARRARAEIDRLDETFAASPEAQALTYAERGQAALARAAVPAELAHELAWPLLREAIHLLDEGATPGQIDRELQKFGFRVAPFLRSDREGLEAVFRRQSGPANGEDWITYSPTLDLMADEGRTGGADAPGWYRHGSDGRYTFEPEVDRLLQASATFQRCARAPIDDEVVVERCLTAAINGTAHVLEAHPDLSPSLVDAIWTQTLGFPKWRGGPLYMARTGACDPLASLERWTKVRNTAGVAAPLLRRIIANA
ncbi:enoyl-CoA hydratase [Caulobacter vibrioides]|uniref:3-hydroxyacyl-CoA dehydrogenase family protein n=1 Tax=Caulobacter vibrioides TaxID=155892 RepID=UPI000BB4DE54|nr:3-hydroxyacyl-CoA dehydrogenase family protein [Caulobacter vibrioides]ATC24782.1 enoyl-CoA hydratase [Caulobacter vibrioides]AZH12944.1 enoyl-CoA hydratase [Caulobacter vibrioides]PLR09557.1 enoyl-CoA hydratase [Caulobacter vibrioides]